MIDLFSLIHFHAPITYLSNTHLPSRQYIFLIHTFPPHLPSRQYLNLRRTWFGLKLYWFRDIQFSVGYIGEEPLKGWCVGTPNEEESTFITNGTIISSGLICLGLWLDTRSSSEACRTGSTSLGWTNNSLEDCPQSCGVLGFMFLFQTLGCMRNLQVYTSLLPNLYFETVFSPLVQKT